MFYSKQTMECFLKKFCYFSPEVYGITQIGASWYFLELALPKIFDVVVSQKFFDNGSLPAPLILSFRINFFEGVWNILLIKICVVLTLWVDRVKNMQS